MFIILNRAGFILNSRRLLYAGAAKASDVPVEVDLGLKRVLKPGVLGLLPPAREVFEYIEHICVVHEPEVLAPVYHVQAGLRSVVAWMLYLLIYNRIVLLHVVLLYVNL